MPAVYEQLFDLPASMNRVSSVMGQPWIKVVVQVAAQEGR
jgi:hypothetical protein